MTDGRLVVVLVFPLRLFRRQKRGDPLGERETTASQLSFSESWGSARASCWLALGLAGGHPSAHKMVDTHSQRGP